jgi:short-subunit dehydrogenase
LPGVELRGKTALLTGATGGLGRAIAAALAGRGATLVLSSRKGDELEAMAASLPGSGHRTIVSDLAEPGAPERLIAEAGALDVLVANAGLPATGRIDQFSLTEIERALRVNLEAPIRMAHELLPGMVERGAGHFVFVSSLAGKAATPRSCLYNATKFGLRGFSLGMREDLRGSGVGASVVMPGFIREAGMFADSGSKPPPGLGTSSPGEVGEAVVSAIERDRAEVHVAPRVQVALANFANRRPDLAGRIAARGGATKIAEDLARGQVDKR